MRFSRFAIAYIIFLSLGLFSAEDCEREQEYRWDDSGEGTPAIRENDRDAGQGSGKGSGEDADFHGGSSK